MFRMAGPILMQVSGKVRPLQFSVAGSTLSSASQPRWSGLPLEVQSIRDWQGDAEVGPVRGSLGLLVFLEGQVDFVARKGRHDRSWSARAGQATLMSGDECPQLLACRGAAQVAAVDIPAKWLTAATAAEHVALRSPLALGAQPSITQRTGALLSHLRQPASDPLTVESLSLDLMASVFAALPVARVAAREGRLTRALCLQLQDYVHEHLGRAITLSELAELCGCSPRRFTTLFKDAFGTSPYQYVMRARLTEAARRLRTSRQDLAAIAYEVGFSSQSHFSSTFHRAFGVRPRDYASHWRGSFARVQPR